MNRIVINQECMHIGENKVGRFNPAQANGLEIRNVDLGQYNGSFAKGIIPTKDVLNSTISSVYDELSNSIDVAQLDYAGVSLTPFIFLAARAFKQKGIQLSDIGLWHNFRNGAPNQVGWSVLGSDKNVKFPTLNGGYISEKLTKDDELIVSLSTSFPLEPDSWYNIPHSECNHYNFYVSKDERNGVDTVFSRVQAESYAISILDFLMLPKNVKYEKIHLIMSTSVAMTFCLSYKLLNESYSKEIYVYHYDGTQSIRRPWGIKFKDSTSQTAVIA